MQTQQARSRSYALQLLSAAFIIFALDSYFTSVSAGELACNRAYAESILTGGALGTGAVMLVAGLSWLLATYSDDSKAIQIILRTMVASVWVVVIVMLALSGMDEGQAMLTGHNQIFVDIAPYVVASAMGAAVIRVARRASSINDEDLPPRVLIAALSGLVAAVISGVFTGIASALSAGWWTDPPPLVVGVIVVMSMLVPAVALVASATAAMASVVHGKIANSSTEDAQQLLSWRNIKLTLGLGYSYSHLPSADVDIANSSQLPEVAE